MRSKTVNGYLTLEAAFLVPLAVFLFVFVIHLSFMMSGRAYLAQDAYVLAFRASMLQEKDDAAGLVAGMAANQVRHKYFGNTQPQTETGTQGKYVVVKVRTKTARSAFDLAPGTDWEMVTGARAIRIDITKRIRKMDRIADMAQLALKGKGAVNASGKKGNGGEQGWN